MAQRVQVILEDDIDGSTAEETIRFGLDGVDYEIDLSEANAEKLRSDMAQWVGHARRLARGRATATASGRKAGSPTEIRAWAQANGIEVNARGRVPASVREAYEAAVR